MKGLAVSDVVSDVSRVSAHAQQQDRSLLIKPEHAQKERPEDAGDPVPGEPKTEIVEDREFHHAKVNAESLAA